MADATRLAIPVGVGLCTFAAIVLPGSELSWLRLIIASIAFVVVAVAGAWTLNHYTRER